MDKRQRSSEREAFRLIEEMLQLMESRGLVELEGAAAKPSAEESGRRVIIKSPMVGTFYRAPAPDAPPFVEVGQEAEVGQVLCIIEAMKLMNEIKSETAGRIVEVLVENGEAVEFGQPLFAIEPPDKP
ncbi:MAG: oxaloacetate decarboxylase, alpha subunit [bacterium]|nr:MAG: oxaloacetate decarboxylase, alpha subunit [bacterium]